MMPRWLTLVFLCLTALSAPRVARAEAKTLLPPELLSFMRESRRLVNTRLKRELGVALRYPTVREGLADVHVAGIHEPA